MLFFENRHMGLDGSQAVALKRHLVQPMSASPELPIIKEAFGPMISGQRVVDGGQQFLSQI